MLSMKGGATKAHHGIFDDQDVEQMRRKVKWEDSEPFHVIPMAYLELQKQEKYGEKLEE